MPISPSLRKIEDAAIPPAEFAAIAGRANVPYFDFGTSELTGDGSHLTFDGAVRLTNDLVRRLGELPAELTPK